MKMSVIRHVLQAGIYEFDEKCYEALCRNNHGRKEGTGSENNDVETNPEDSCYTVMHGLSAGRKK